MNYLEDVKPSQINAQANYVTTFGNPDRARVARTLVELSQRNGDKWYTDFTFQEYVDELLVGAAEHDEEVLREFARDQLLSFNEETGIYAMEENLIMKYMFLPK